MIVLIRLVAVHTGLRLGANLNLALMLTFLAVLALGGVAGAVTALESRAGSPPPPWAKRWRPRLGLVHALLTWPLPVLVAFHVLAFYLSGND